MAEVTVTIKIIGDSKEALLQTILSTLTPSGSSKAPTPTANVTEPPVATLTLAVKDTTSEAIEEVKASEVDFEAVRAQAILVMNAGKRDKLKDIIESHGSSTLAEIPASEYSSILAELEAAL